MTTCAHRQALCFNKSPSGLLFPLNYQIYFIGQYLLGRVLQWKTVQWPPYSWSLISFSVASTNDIMYSCFVSSHNVKFSFVVMSVDYDKWLILFSVPSYSSFTSWNRFITFSVYVAFKFFQCFVIVNLLAKSNNWNTPKATLVAATVPHVVCTLRFCGSSFYSNLI